MGNTTTVEMSPEARLAARRAACEGNHHWGPAGAWAIAFFLIILILVIVILIVDWSVMSDAGRGIGITLAILALGGAIGVVAWILTHQKYSQLYDITSKVCGPETPVVLTGAAVVPGAGVVQGAAVVDTSAPPPADTVLVQTPPTSTSSTTTTVTSSNKGGDYWNPPHED